MRVVACLLLALFVSSAFFGVCIGDVWFEGVDPQEPREIRLSMQRTQPIVSSYTHLPACDLILSEAESQIVNLTIRVYTAALFYQDGDFETWLSIDDQEPEKLVGVLHVQPSAAGESFSRQYSCNMSGLGDGAHFIKIQVAGDYYGPEGGNYDCEGDISFIVDQDQNQPFPDTTITAAFAIAILILVATGLFIYFKRTKKS